MTVVLTAPRRDFRKLKSLILPVDRSDQRERALNIVASSAESIAAIHREKLAGESELGLCAWFVRPKPKPNGTDMRLFDFQCSVAISALIIFGFEPRIATALVDLDFVEASDDGRVSTKLAERTLVWLGDVKIAGGKMFSIFAAAELETLQPQDVQGREGYGVNAFVNGRMAPGEPLAEVRRHMKEVRCSVPAAMRQKAHSTH